MRPTVLIIAVLFLHGVSGHLFQQAVPHKLTKHMRLHKDHNRQSDVEECVDQKIEDAFKANATLALVCEKAAEEAYAEFDDDDDLSQAEVDAFFSVICRPDCGNLFISASDDCGEFDGDDAYLKDLIIGLCGTNQNGDKCYEIFLDAEDDFDSQEDCYEAYEENKQCNNNCRATLEAGVREQGCCLDIYYDILREENNVHVSDLYDACGVDTPTGCNNSPIGSGFIPQVALVTLISALIFSAVFIY